MANAQNQSPAVASHSPIAYIIPEKSPFVNTFLRKKMEKVIFFCENFKLVAIA